MQVFAERFAGMSRRLREGRAGGVSARGRNRANRLGCIRIKPPHAGMVRVNPASVSNFSELHLIVLLAGSHKRRCLRDLIGLNDLKTFGFLRPRLRAIMRSRPAFATIAQVDDKQTVGFGIEQRFELPAQFFHPAHGQAAAKDRILQTPSITVDEFINLAPTLRLGDVITDDVPVLMFHKLVVSGQWLVVSYG